MGIKETTPNLFKDLSISYIRTDNHIISEQINNYSNHAQHDKVFFFFLIMKNVK